MSEFGVRNVSVRFGHTLALDAVSLDAPRGQVTAVVGGDGAGKSTLLRLLAHRVAAATGEVRSPGRARLGYQPATSGVWPTLTVGENLAFVARAFGMPEARIRSRGDELLERAGLTAARRRLGGALSGGMRQKLGFVLAILHEPELVLLDEPSTGVDPVSRVELWRLIAATAAAGTAVAMTTTYLDEAQRAASVLALDTGRMLASGTPDEIVAAVPGTITRLAADAPLSPEVAARSWRRGTERHVWFPASEPSEPSEPAQSPAQETPLLGPLPEGGRMSPNHDVRIAQCAPRAEKPDFEDALIALSLAARGVPDEIDPAEPVPAAIPAMSASGTSAGSASSDALAVPAASATHVTKTYGGFRALDDVSLDVQPGEVLGLIGANGAGKTTLLRIMLGLESADVPRRSPTSGSADGGPPTWLEPRGAVAVFGSPPDRAGRHRIGYVPQGLGLDTTLSVQENVAFLSRVYGVPEPELPGSLQGVRSHLVSDIGLGRQRQLAFALALAHDPELLVLDEPTSGVDPLARARLWDVIHDQAAAGRAVVVTTHYLQEAEQCTRLALLSHGRILGTGTIADLTDAGRPDEPGAVLVRSGDWQRALNALDRAGLPVMLTGRDIRVAGERIERVREALGAIHAEVAEVPVTLEETVVLLDREAGVLKAEAA